MRRSRGCSKGPREMAGIAASLFLSADGVGCRRGGAVGRCCVTASRHAFQAGLSGPATGGTGLGLLGCCWRKGRSTGLCTDPRCCCCTRHSGGAHGFDQLGLSGLTAWRGCSRCQERPFSRWLVSRLFLEGWSVRPALPGVLLALNLSLHLLVAPPTGRGQRRDDARLLPTGWGQSCKAGCRPGGKRLSLAAPERRRPGFDIGSKLWPLGCHQLLHLGLALRGTHGARPGGCWLSRGGPGLGLGALLDHLWCRGFVHHTGRAMVRAHRVGMPAARWRLEVVCARAMSVLGSSPTSCCRRPPRAG